MADQHSGSALNSTESKYRANFRHFVPMINMLLNKTAGLYDMDAVKAQAKRDNPSFEQASAEAQAKMLQDAFSKRNRQSLIDMYWTFARRELLWQVLCWAPLSALTLLRTGLLLYTWWHGNEIAPLLSFSKMPDSVLATVCIAFLAYLVALVGNIGWSYFFSSYSTLAAYIRWYCWPHIYIESPLEEVEHYYIAKKDLLPARFVTYIESKFNHYYQNQQTPLNIDLMEEIKMVIDLSQPARYAPLHFDKALLEQKLQNYKPAIQKQIKTAVFMIEKVSTSVSEGKKERHAFLFAGPPGTGKSRLIKLLFEACNLPYPMKVNLEGNQEEILGTPERSGRYTEARIARGYDINASLGVVLEDADRALKDKDSTVHLNILDPKEFIYNEPFLKKIGLTIDLPPITFVTVNEIPPKRDAQLDRFSVVIKFDDPFTEQGFLNIGMDYLAFLFKKYEKQDDAPTEKDFTAPEHEAIKQLIHAAKQEKKSIRQLENRIRDYFMEKWQGKS